MRWTHRSRAAVWRRRRRAADSLSPPDSHWPGEGSEHQIREHRRGCDGAVRQARFQAKGQRPKGPSVPTYVMLSTLTPEGVQTLKSNPQRLREVNKEIEQLGV